MYLVLKMIVPGAVTGGIDNIFDIVSRLPDIKPVAGNRLGSYLTMGSLDGLAFAGVHTLGNFGLVL